MIAHPTTVLGIGVNDQYSYQSNVLKLEKGLGEEQKRRVKNKLSDIHCPHKPKGAKILVWKLGF